MYIESVPNRNSPPCILLRQSSRQGKKVIKRTLANLSSWPEPLVEGLRTLLKGGTAVENLAESFEKVRSLPHGHVGAVWGTLRQLGLLALLSRKPGRERQLVAAMVVASHPGSRLQVGHRPGAGLREPAEHSGYGGRDCKRPGGWALRGSRLAAGAPEPPGEKTGAPSPSGGLSGAVRSDLQLLRRAPLSAGQAGLLARRQEGQAADRDRHAVQPARLPGGGGSLRRQRGRPQHAGLPDREAAKALRLALGGDRGGSGADHERPHQRGSPAARAGLDHGVAGATDRQTAGSGPSAAFAL